MVNKGEGTNKVYAVQKHVSTGSPVLPLLILTRKAWQTERCTYEDAYRRESTWQMCIQYLSSSLAQLNAYLI